MIFLSSFTRNFLLLSLIFLSIFVILFCFVSNSNNKAVVTNYTLKKHKNTVALYNGDEIVKTYNHIVFNTLPQKDMENFTLGIKFASREEAENYLDHFDN